MHRCEMVRTKHVRMAQNITPGIQGAANRGPTKAQRSGFGGERRSSGTTELLPLKAKRRMWSLRRRGTPFSSIFRRAAKDGVPEGRWKSRTAGKNVQRRMGPPEVVTRRSRPVKPHNPSIAIKKRANAGNSYVGPLPYGSASLRREVI